jgi:hypothetical protein
MSVERINDPAIDFSTKLHLGPSYRYNKLIPTSGSQTFSLQQSSTVNTQFELSSNCYNLSKSKLVFDIKLDGQANLFNVIHADPLAMFDRIQLYTRSGIQLVDLNSANNFSKMVSPYVTKFDELQQRSNGGMKVNTTTGLYISCATQAEALLCPIQGLQTSVIAVVGNTDIDNSNQRPDGNSAEVPINEMRYLYAGISSATAGLGALCLSYQLNLGIIYDTLLSVNKDLYWDTNLILSLTFAPYSKFAFTTNSLTLGSTPTIANVTAITVNNTSLFLALETNQDIISQLRNKVQTTGLTLQIPYVYTQKYASSSSSSASLFQRFNSGMGQRLVRFYYSAFHTTESGLTAFDNSNITPKITDIYTSLNNQRLQEYPLVLAKSEDYMFNEQLFRESCIISVNMYKYNWIHCDNFGNNILTKSDLTEPQGISLNEEKTFTVFVNQAAAAYNHYLFTVVQRELIIHGPNIVLH